MEPGKIKRLLELIGEIVGDEGTWQEKKAAVLAAADETDKVWLSEFVGWFEDIDIE